MNDAIIKRIRRMIDDDRGDDLERAIAAFRGYSVEDMGKQHGQSGRTRQEILDGYFRDRAEHEDMAGALLIRIPELRQKGGL
jgi:hypothetical protein